jgi:transcriptional regulator with XRE-family HTH domain
MTKFKTPALKKLQEWAKSNELSNKDFATLLSCDPSQVWRWLNGDALPNAVKRMAISLLTSGFVSELDWLTAAELKELAGARALVEHWLSEHAKQGAA